MLGRCFRPLCSLSHVIPSQLFSLPTFSTAPCPGSSLTFSQSLNLSFLFCMPKSYCLELPCLPMFDACGLSLSSSTIGPPPGQEP